MSIEILQGDCIDSLKKLEDQSVNTCITSPPYWGLRNYNDEEKQLGMEDTPKEFVNNLVNVFRKIKRVLRDDGTVWLNLGDSYGKNKQLTGIPWRVAFALQQDGWYLRQDIIWHKSNPMPESVRDRCTKAHEYIFLLSKNVKYYYDHEAIKEDAKYPQGPNSSHAIRKGVGDPKMKTRGGLHKIGAIAKKNKRSVWTVTTKPFKGAHFATFPKDLIEPCVLAGCPEKICVECSEPYKRMTSRNSDPLEVDDSTLDRYGNGKAGVHRKVGGQYQKWLNENPLVTVGWEKQCDCQTNETKGGTVLDPFGGSGTTGIVAAQHNRNAVLLELNQEYIDLAKDRINKELGIFGQGVQND